MIYNIYKFKYLAARIGKGEKIIMYWLSIKKLLTFVLPFKTLNANILGKAIPLQAWTSP